METYYDTTGQCPNDIMVIETDSKRHTASTVEMNHNWAEFKERVRIDELATAIDDMKERMRV